MLHGKYLYVTSQGEHVPLVDVPYEDRNWLLVYDREDRLPGTGGVEQPQSKDRDILYALPINFADAPTAIAAKGSLLFVSSQRDGVAVISLANPAKPSVVRFLKNGRVDGQVVSFIPKNPDSGGKTRLEFVGDDLHITPPVGYRFVFDASRPSLPQVGVSRVTGQATVPLNETNAIVLSQGSLDFQLYDASNPYHINRLGSYESHGFSVPAGLVDAFALTTIGGTNLQADAKGPRYWPLYDFSDPAEIHLLDVAYQQGEGDKEQVGSSLLTDDGVLLVRTDRRLRFIDTMVTDLAWSIPTQGATGVPTGSNLTLCFTVAPQIPDGEDAASYLQQFIKLVRVTGDESGEPAEFTVQVDADDSRKITIVPSSALQPSASYRLQLSASSDAAGRRTVGLFDHTIGFKTATDDKPEPRIVAIAPSIVTTKGGTIAVDVKNPADPVFTLAGVVAPESATTSRVDLDGGGQRIYIDAPPNVAGPAALKVTNENGAFVQLLGAVQYVEPLVLKSISPTSGSLAGGTRVTIKGLGFRPDAAQISVSFGDLPVAEDDIKVIDPETIEVVTPAGRIGKADVRVSLDNGQSEVLPKAFEYLQPAQSNIAGNGKIYDMVLDPTGTYLVAGQGNAVVIYNIDASTFTGGDTALNEDALLKKIDLNNDGVDDRIVSRVSLPNGYLATGVATYFEHGTDRVMVSATRPGDGGQSAFFVIGFDSINPKNTTILTQLPLFSNLARGLEVENSRAVVAMGNGGLGFVDILLPTKAYLSSHFSLPDGHQALDVTRVATKAGEPELYAVAAGNFDISTNSLVDEQESTTGAMYLIRHSAGAGYEIVSKVEVPCSRVKVVGTTAYLSAGANGLVIVDIGDPANPKILSRVNTVGCVYDIDVNGNTAYLALGDKGVLTVDVTDPEHPTVTDGMESYGGNVVWSVLGNNYSAVAGGNSLQVFPDVVLKVFRIDPENGILDYDTDHKLTVRLRFNKAIDLWPANLDRFKVYGPDGNPIAADVDIVGNDAIITILAGNGLAVGDTLSVEAQAGIKSIKPINDQVHIDLYTLRQNQRFALTYRGGENDILGLNAVVPRRIPTGRSAEITISGLGIPTDPARVKAYLSDVELSVKSIESNDDAERAAIITAEVPPIAKAGQYDVIVSVEKAGVWQKLVLRGALLVDSPIEFTSLTPGWGPRTGGTSVTVYGQGFEPGNTVMEGLKLRIGGVPVTSVRVLSSERMVITTTGRPGGQKRPLGSGSLRQRDTSLTGDAGFGYGLKLIGSQSVDFAPFDVWVDQETGVALTNGGYFTKNQFLQIYEGQGLSDSIRAASFDVQEPTQPLLVGGSPALPSGDEGREQIGKAGSL